MNWSLPRRLLEKLINDWRIYCALVCIICRLTVQSILYPAARRKSEIINPATGLTGVIYILDEPSVGLHPRDNDKLISTLKFLRDQDNTVIVV